MGILELAIGPMFSGKSSWLIQKMHELQKNGTPHLAVNFKDDNRYSKDAISSHDKTHYMSYRAKNVGDIRKLLEKHPGITHFGIDEVHFFEKELADFLIELKQKGITVLAAGLDTDFLGMPWEVTTKLIKNADIINEFKAICSICGQKVATRTQRLINGMPASKKSPRVLIGAAESYTARCDTHHEIAV